MWHDHLHSESWSCRDDSPTNPPECFQVSCDLRNQQLHGRGERRTTLSTNPDIRGAIIRGHRLRADQTANRMGHRLNCSYFAGLF